MTMALPLYPIVTPPTQIALPPLHLMPRQLSPANPTPSHPPFPGSVTLAYCQSPIDVEVAMPRRLGTSCDGNDLVQEHALPRKEQYRNAWSHSFLDHSRTHCRCTGQVGHARG